MSKPDIVNKYCQMLKRALKCPPTAKKYIVDVVRCDLSEYLLQHPNATLIDLINEFGEPDAYMREYSAFLKTDNLYDLVRGCQLKYSAILIGLIAVLLIVIMIA